MVEIVSKLSNIDIALDIINECKNKNIVELEYKEGKLSIKS